MATNKVSGAQFEDFPPTHRRHYQASAQGQLGPGLAPREEGKVIPVNLARSRVAHDGAELHEDPTSFVSTAGRQAAAGGTLLPPLMSSYQAMQAGVSLEQKKRSGKRLVAPVEPAKPSGLFLGGTSGAVRRSESPAALMMGTTKQSPYVPGYCGHIPKTMTTADPIPARPIDKSLIVENYKPYGPGYTGRKGI